MKVTIVVPFYNAEQYIERCARSVLEQTHPDLELVFVDDGCTDKSVERLEHVLSCYEGRDVVVLHHSRNLGSAMARATGMRRATGEYMIQVDSDDFVVPTYVEELLRAAVEADADIAICDYRRIYANSQRSMKVRPVTDREELIGLLISGEAHNYLWNKLVRTRLVADNDIYPLEGVNMFDDKSLAFRFVYFATRGIVYVPRVLYNYDKTNVNSLSRISKQSAVAPARSVLQLINTFFAVHPISDSALRNVDYFRVQVMALELLSGEQYTLSPAPKVPLSMICHHPLLPLHHKVAAFCRRYNLRYIGRLLRWCYKRMSAQNYTTA